MKYKAAVALSGTNKKKNRFADMQACKPSVA